MLSRRTFLKVMGITSASAAISLPVFSEQKKANSEATVRIITNIGNGYFNVPYIKLIEHDAITYKAVESIYIEANQDFTLKKLEAKLPSEVCDSFDVMEIDWIECSIEPTFIRKGDSVSIQFSDNGIFQVG